jgi:hypothetical protein
MLDKDRAALEKIFGPAVVFEIENLFDFRGGPALRHEIAHGLVSWNECQRPDAIYACWFMFKLCCLPIGQYWSNRVRLPPETGGLCHSRETSPSQEGEPRHAS